ncbi:MAG: GntR family transcriptional regulator [Solirubrobacteraceae bacterium]
MAVKASWGLGTVDRRSMTDQVLYEIRTAILTGRIKPAEQLPEAVLARAFGTGRSAIREALRQLVQEGLVVAEPNRGAHVRQLEPADVIDLYIARTLIEVEAAQRAIARPGRLELHHLRGAHQRIQRATPRDPTTLASAELIAANLDFHRAMVALAGSPRLTRAHEPLAAESQMLLAWHPPYPGPDYAADHQILLTAIKTRDPNIAQLVGDHLKLTS